MDVDGKLQTPSALAPERLGNLAGQQDWSGMMRKISPSQEFELRKAQLVASYYTEEAILVHWRTQPGK